jgi:hypothetical protein
LIWSLVPTGCYLHMACLLRFLCLVLKSAFSDFIVNYDCHWNESIFCMYQSANVVDSFVGIFSYKPFDEQLDWSLTAKASPCYITVSFSFYTLLCMHFFYSFMIWLSVLTVFKRFDWSNRWLLQE